jgi:hypothetical protein
MDASWKKGLGWKEAQKHGDFTNNFSIYAYMTPNIYTGCVRVKIYMYTATG